MSINAIVDSTSVISQIFSSVSDFNMQTPFERQRSMTFRSVGEMKPYFLNGPLRNSKIFTPDKDWNLGSLSLNTVRDKLTSMGLYGILTGMQDEGGTVWILTPDSKWSNKEGIKELDRIISSDISGRRWMSAFTTAQKEMKNSDAPFALTAIVSVTCQILPFFGRVAFGTAFKEGVISLVQIPTMGSNKNQYFSWLFVPKDKSMDSNDWINKFGKGGGENDYSKFTKIREYLWNECDQANIQGDYTQNKDTKQEKPKEDKKEEPVEDPSKSNPLLDAAMGKQNKPESYITESLYNARSFISEVYLGHPVFESDEDGEDTKVDPYENKLKMEGGIPKFGPLY